MVTAEKYTQAFSNYSKRISTESRTSGRRHEAKLSLKNAGLLTKKGSEKKTIVNR